MMNWKGWGFYKQGKYKESYEILLKAWELAPVYDGTIKSHLEAARKAVAGQGKKEGETRSKATQFRDSGKR